jgi:hypothetical protein
MSGRRYSRFTRGGEELVTVLPHLEEQELAWLVRARAHGRADERLLVPHLVDEGLHETRPLLHSRRRYLSKS